MEFASVGNTAGCFDFVPIAMEVGGRLGADTLRLLSKLSDVTAASSWASLQGGVCAPGARRVGVLFVSRQRGLEPGCNALLASVAGSAVQVGVRRRDSGFGGVPCMRPM